jgi:hypothetical protein
MALLMAVATTEVMDQHTISKNRQRLGVLVSEATRRKTLRLRNLGCGSSEKEEMNMAAKKKAAKKTAAKKKPAAKKKK